MIKVISQPREDEFTLRTFFKLIDKLEKNSKKFDAFYLWSPSIIDGALDIISSSIKNDLVILAIKDNLTAGNNFNPWNDAQPGLVEYVTNLFEEHKGKKFILLTSLENLESYINYKNVNIISWGGDITNQMIKYKSLPVILEKNLDSNKIFLSLNRNNRTHRIYLISLILGLGLENNGMISCMFSSRPINDLGWKFNTSNILLKDVFIKGNNKMSGNLFDIKNNKKIYENNDNDNFSNYQNVLKKYYYNTFIEIISETSFTESSFLITEKTQNCFYGCNFPIWISSKGTVSYLRNLGFDVFDDIIDHSYDDIDNPIERIYHAINNNILILTDIDLVKQLWIKNQCRFRSNIKFLQNEFYNKLYNQVEKKFNELI